MKPVYAFCIAALVIAQSVWAAPSADSLKEQLEKFASLLDEAKSAELHLPFDAPEHEGWNFFPTPHVGLSMHGLGAPQREALDALLQFCMSESGLEKAEAIRMRETVLGGTYDEEAYYLAIFGDETNGEPWTLRWEGHHLSLNWTIVGGEVVASTPQFMGANPTVIQEGEHKGERTLTVEENLARELVKSLNAEQATKGITLDKAPSEILTRMYTTAKRQDEEGILYSELDEAQQEKFRALVEEYIQVQNPALAKARREKVEAEGWDHLQFAWMGGVEVGEGHYYRIQGKEFLIEYDNTQNNANHVHCVWRNFNGDFGRDALKAHYQQAHNTHPMLNWNR